MSGKIKGAAVSAIQRGKFGWGLPPLIANVVTTINFPRLLLWGFVMSGVTYALFQKKLLPKPISKIVSIVFFLPTYPFTYLLRWKNWKTPIDETLILGVAPMALLNHPQQLHKLGVRGVVNMCAEYNGPLEAYTELGIKQLRLPTVDHFEPKLDYMEDAVNFIQSHKDRGEKVYVHCKAGHGRAASIALCWMLHADKQLSAKDGNAMLCSKRKVRPTLFKQENVLAFKKKIDADSDKRSL